MIDTTSISYENSLKKKQFLAHCHAISVHITNTIDGYAHMEQEKRELKNLLNT